MTELRVLQEARVQRSTRQRMRRRARRRQRTRRLRHVIGALLVLAIVVLVFDAARTGSTAGLTVAQRQAAIRQALASVSAPEPRSNTATAASAVAHLSTYGRIPDSVQVLHPNLGGSLASGLLFDVRSGRYLWARRPMWRLPIASLTKMMTALVVVAHSRPHARVLITKAAIDFTGSGVGLLPLGKRISELDLLYGLLLPSGNDAAIALAQHVARTQRAFIADMNAQARTMGLRCSRFASVSGVVDRGNDSCAFDLAAIADAVLRNRTLAPIVGSPTKILPFPIKGSKLFLTNNNPLMLGGYAGIDGVKTGFTTEAGLCIVAAARRGHDWLAVVLLHSANWQTQAEALLNDGFAALAAARHSAAASRGSGQTAATRSSSSSSSSVS